MSIRDYIKEKLPFIIINTMMFLLISIFMGVSGTKFTLIIISFGVWFLPITIYMVTDLVKKKLYFDELKNTIENLEEKYLLSEIIDKPDFIEGKVVYDILKQSNRAMSEEVRKYGDMQIEYREYIEAWVHEIKTPIASSKLIIENNESPATNKIKYELKKVEGFIEQALYYARSTDVSKDYIVKTFPLKTVIMAAVKNNSRDFITKKVALDIKDIEYSIYSDIKWVEFIINQLIINSIKYTKENEGKVTISAKRNMSNIILSIQDNGVGIIDKDINRVFDKGFTGDNGRRFGKSTGMGLYLCKNLCNKLGLGIKLNSKVNEGTIVELIFPIGNFSNIKES